MFAVQSTMVQFKRVKDAKTTARYKQMIVVTKHFNIWLSMSLVQRNL